jgi:hypothetical protein
MLPLVLEDQLPQFSSCHDFQRRLSLQLHLRSLPAAGTHRRLARPACPSYACQLVRSSAPLRIDLGVHSRQYRERRCHSPIIWTPRQPSCRVNCQSRLHRLCMSTAKPSVFAVSLSPSLGDACKRPDRTDKQCTMTLCVGAEARPSGRSLPSARRGHLLALGCL